MKKKNIFKLIAASFIVAMVSLAGCQKMEIVKIVGFIQGHVFDGNTNEPLDSVKVVWSVAGVKDSVVASAQDGYLISNLPEGSYSIWCSKANYTTVVSDISIQNTDLSNTTVRGGESKEQIVTYNPNLYPLSAGITGRIYKTENGVNIPAAGAKVQLDYNSQNVQDDQYYRFVPNLYTATTDTNGYFTFTNIPATYVTIRFLDYVDANGETYYDPNSHGTYTRKIYLNENTNYSYGNLTLTQSGDAICLTNSNAWSATGVESTDFDVSSDITLTFNKDVDETLTLSQGYVILTWGGHIVASTVSFSGNTITINPDENLSPGKTYIVSYDVYSAQEYDHTHSSFTFTTADNATVPEQVTNFAIDYNQMGAGWKADFYTKDIYFSFDRISNADRYEIFARDNYHNSEYIKIKDYYPSDYEQGTISTLAQLPSIFDYYESDGAQTPLSHGTIVSYKIRAVNSAGEGPFSNVVTVKDETSFDSFDMSIDDNQYDAGGNNISANNSANGSSIEITMYFYLFPGRYADVSVTPNVRLWNGATEITGLSSSVSWTDHQNGVITFTVPANTDYSGMQLRLHNITDSSGNTMDPNDYESETLY